MRARLDHHSWLLWPSLIGAAFLIVRATTTLAMRASFETPGDGWRSVWQLAVAGVLVVGIVRPELARTTVGIVTAIYAVSTGLELVDGTQLLGVVPVDMRDRIVHPFLAIAGLLCLIRDRQVDTRATLMAAGGHQR